jgi:methylene-fatty-acyl-phospholipid synthase
LEPGGDYGYTLHAQHLQTSLVLTLATVSLADWIALEYRSKFITRIFGGNGLYGCYALAATIFTLGLIRDAM